MSSKLLRPNKQSPESRPVIDPIFPGELKQLDFSSLPGRTGWEWADALKSKQEFIGNMKILRIYNGAYGAIRTPDGELVAGGLELHLRELDETLASKYPIDIQVVCRSYYGQEDFEVQKPGWKGKIKVHGIPNIGSKPKAHSKEIMDLVRESEADIVHIHNSQGFMYAGLAKKLEKEDVGVALTFHSQPKPEQDKPLAGIVQGNDFLRTIELFKEYAREDGLLGPLKLARDIGYKLIFRMAGRGKFKKSLYDLAEKRGETPYASYSLLGVSDSSLEEYGDRDSLAVGNPVNHNFFNPESVPVEIREDTRIRYGATGKRVIAYHARIDPDKGQEYLLDVAKKLKEKTDQDFKVIIVGSVNDPHYFKKMKEKAKELGLEDNFVIEEGKTQQEIRNILSISDVVAFPSKHEGLGRTGIEAMMMKVPVVASNVGGIPYYVKEGETGYLTEVGDTEKIAEKITHLLKNPDQAKHMGEVGRVLCIREYSSQNVAENYVKLVYAPMIAGKKQNQKK